LASFLFLHDSPFEYPGVLSLCGYLKEKGHRVDVLIKASEGKAFWPKVKEFKPDWVGFSSVISVHHESLRLAQQAKEILAVGTVFGGPYATYYPDVINRPEVDVVIRGEGEEALVDFLNAHDRGEDYISIPNVWTKRGETVIANSVRPLEANLDKYPVPNHSFYLKYDSLRKIHSRQFMTGRGCLFNCYFCFNQEFHKLYNLKGRSMVRRFSVDHVLEELTLCKAAYPMNRVCFNDDIYVTDLTWLEEFLPRYKKEINLPFECQVRVNMIKPEIVKILSENCCHLVLMGLESGNPRVRNEIMGKKFSNEQFINAVELLHRYGIRVTTYNVLGCPTETLDEALQTMELNARAKTDHPWCSLYQPHPGTRTEAIARQHGYLKEGYTPDDMPGSIFFRSLLNQPEISQVVRLQKLFYFGVRHPRLIPLIRRLVKFNLLFLYQWIFLLGYFFRCKHESGESYLSMIRLGLKRLRNYGYFHFHD
jgi:radical SAM superfamily enzyme YgiQ (UPF0313 family)